ncbi:GNAT family N-acetyltransferase, partial [Thalassobacillus pellis]|uniref:GNAT family N-acetyltransferase n=1 Tax=Thalassobacillus pellis TaxID=748008 RepID=UPI0019619344
MARLQLTKFQKEDFEDYFKLVADIKVMAQITERAIPLEEAQVNYEKLLMRNSKHEILGSYKIHDTNTNEFVGLGHLTWNEDCKKEAEIGYMLVPKHWGKRYGTE